MGDVSLFNGDLMVYDFVSQAESLIKKNVSTVVVGCYTTTLGPDIAWSPNGKSVAFSMMKGDRGVKDILSDFSGKKNLFEVFKEAELGVYIYDLNKKELNFVADGDSVKWQADGKGLFIKSFNWPENPKITKIDLVDNGRMEVVLENDINLSYRPYMEVIYSKDGKYLAYLGDKKCILESPSAVADEIFNGRLHYWLWIKEVDTGKETRMSSAGLLELGFLADWLEK